MPKKIPIQDWDAHSNFDDIDPHSSPAEVGPAAEAPVRSGRVVIQYIPLDDVQPNRFQPRAELPLELREAFYGGQMGWREAITTWNAIEQNRPSKSYQDLVFLADSIYRQGQIKPATGYYENQAGRARFYLVTGERRFWAWCLNAIRYPEAFLAKAPTLEAKVIDKKDALTEADETIAENLASRSLTIVGKARAVASILLSFALLENPRAIHLRPEECPDEYDYFRQALARWPQAAYDEVQKVMAVDRNYARRLLNILQFSSPVLYKIDHFSVPERKVREVLEQLKTDAERELAVDQIISENLSLDDLENIDVLTTPGGRIARSPRDPIGPSVKFARKIWSVFANLDRDLVGEDPLGILADSLVEQLGAPSEVERTAGQLEELARKIRLRSTSLGGRVTPRR